MEQNARVDTAAKRPSPVDDKKSEQTFLAALMNLEGTVRGIENEDALRLHLCNATRNFLHFSQAFFLEHVVAGDRMRVKAATSVPTIDRGALLIRWIERLTANLVKDVGENTQHNFTLPAYAPSDSEENTEYPYSSFLWTPFVDRGVVTGGLLVARELPWAKNERELALRLAGLYAHAMRTLRADRKPLRERIFSKKRTIAAVLLLFALAFIPFPISSVAPVEVASEDPFVVSAPFNGVVREILVEQGRAVAKGDPIIAIEDVERRNEFDIASEEEEIAQARYLLASKSAIGDRENKRHIAVSRAELGLATARRIYAKDLLDQTTIRAPRDGIVLFSDKRDWMGRPVRAGEKVMEIADPASFRFAISLPVGESIVLKRGARVKVYLDSDPLNAIEAKVTESSYQPRNDKRGILAYELSAQIVGGKDGMRLRFGAQGSARIYAESAPLIYVLFRRPLVSLRQILGL